MILKLWQPHFPWVTVGTSEREPSWDLKHAQWAQTLAGSSSFIILSLWGTNSHKESKLDPCWTNLTGLVHICHEILRVRYRKSHSSGIWGSFEDNFSIVTCASEIQKVMTVMPGFRSNYERGQETRLHRSFCTRKTSTFVQLPATSFGLLFLHFSQTCIKHMIMFTFLQIPQVSIKKSLFSQNK